MERVWDHLISGDLAQEINSGIMSFDTDSTRLQEQLQVAYEHFSRTAPNKRLLDSQDGKIFVGGLSWYTTADSMRQYFQRFGDVAEAIVMRHPTAKTSRGFGFVTFKNPDCVHHVLQIKDHHLDGKKVDPQPANKEISPARSVNNIDRKVFIGGVSKEATLEDVKSYFNENFGQVEDAVLKHDYQRDQHRGFGFVTFKNGIVAEHVCRARFHTIKGKTLECKRAQRKEFVDQTKSMISMLADYLYKLPPEELATATAAFMCHQQAQLGSRKLRNMMPTMFANNMPASAPPPPLLGAGHRTTVGSMHVADDTTTSSSSARSSPVNLPNIIPQFAYFDGGVGTLPMNVYSRVV